MLIDFSTLGQELTAAGLAGKPVDQYTKEEVEVLCISCARAIMPEKGAKFTEPYLDKDELVIPVDSDPRFHYWKKCGQSIFDTLRELKAPDHVWRKYVDTTNEPF
jgi:hypothetical protein